MPSSLPLLLLAGMAAAVLAVCLTVRDLLERRRTQLERRWAGPEEEVLLPPEGLVAAPPSGWRERFDAGFRQLIGTTGLPVSPEQALGVMALAAVLLGGGLALWQNDWWPALPGVAAGVVVPLVVFHFLHARRRRRLQDQLPDALFLLARTLRAGLSLEEALATVGEQGVRPLADEFRSCTAYFRLGLPAPAALQLLANRLQLADLSGLAALVLLHRTSGGNLPSLLDRWAASTRDRNQFRGYVRAATAMGRVNALALAAAPPLLLLGYWIVQPDYLTAFVHTSTGGVILAVAALLEAVGSVWVYGLSRVDY